MAGTVTVATLARKMTGGAPKPMTGQAATIVRQYLARFSSTASNAEHKRCMPHDEEALGNAGYSGSPERPVELATVTPRYQGGNQGSGKAVEEKIATKKQGVDLDLSKVWKPRDETRQEWGYSGAPPTK